VLVRTSMLSEVRQKLLVRGGELSCEAEACRRSFFPPGGLSCEAEACRISYFPVGGLLCEAETCRRGLQLVGDKAS
jgi:hypothetical protein